MTRPCKCRRVSGQPRSFLFKPCGVPFRELQETCLTLDELEAVRLADLEELYQEEAASRMGVSRQTFGNIIRSAHGKIADALVNAKSLKIAGGVVQLDAQQLPLRPLPQPLGGRSRSGESRHLPEMPRRWNSRRQQGK